MLWHIHTENSRGLSAFEGQIVFSLLHIAGCISSGLLGVLIIRLQRTVVLLCFPELSPELSMTSDESWCVSDLTIGWVLGQKKLQSQLHADNQLSA